MNQPIKVAMLMTDLEDLGVQRIVINLFNHFDRNQIDPSLILWNNEGKVAHFLNQKLGKIFETDASLLKPRLFFRLFRYYRLIKKIQPDVVLSFVPVTNVSYTLIKLFLPRHIKFIACEHAFISRAFSTGEYKGAFKVLYKLLFRRMYNNIVDKLIMTAVVGKKDAIENWKIDPDKIEVIYNPQDIKELQQRASEVLDDGWFTLEDQPILIGAGRLTQQKGFASLIEAFAKLQDKVPSKLAILGRGEQEAELKALVIALGIESKVRFLGFQTNHLKYIKNSTVFVLSSVWEAMPMVVAETMVIGTPIVSFDCPSGPFEMLDGGACGFLVEDQNVDAMVKVLELSLIHPEISQKKAQAAIAKVSNYDVAKITQEYQKLIYQLTQSKKWKIA